MGGNRDEKLSSHSSHLIINWHKQQRINTAMSLASFNSPLLLTLSGAGALVGLPALETAIRNGSVSFLTVKTANALLFALNLYAVQRPGRLDGKLQEEMIKWCVPCFFSFQTAELTVCASCFLSSTRKARSKEK